MFSCIFLYNSLFSLFFQVTTNQPFSFPGKLQQLLFSLIHNPPVIEVNIELFELTSYFVQSKISNIELF